MTKTLNIQALIPAFIVATVLLFSALVALPVGAQAITEDCTLTKDIVYNGTTIVEGSVVMDGSGSIGKDASSPTSPVKVKEWGTICLVNTINVITDWAFFLLVSVSFILILIAGFLWMTGGTNPENQKKAGQMIAAALVGIVIAILSRVIPGIVIGILS